jgi:hypothetical protein
VLVIATDAMDGAGLVDQVRDGRPADEVEAAIVAPVVEPNAVKQAAGDLGPAERRARERLDSRLGELRGAGIRAAGLLGDTDPLLAAEDALKGFAADEVLVFERAGDQARWFEDGMFERAQSTLEPPIRMVTMEGEAENEPHPVAERRAAAGVVAEPAGPEREIALSPYLPRFESGDLAAIAVGVVGTIAAIALFAAGPGTETAAGAAQGLIALAAGLINVAHVVGLLLFESVRYRGPIRRFVRTATLLIAPAAVVASAIVLIAS